MDSMDFSQVGEPFCEFVVLSVIALVSFNFEFPSRQCLDFSSPWFHKLCHCAILLHGPFQLLFERFEGIGKGRRDGLWILI